MLAQRAREDRGFTLVETILAIVLLLVGILGTVALVDYANRATAGNRDRAAANNIARRIAETAKQLPYTSLTSGGVTSSLQGLIDADPATAGMQADSDPLTTAWDVDSVNGNGKAIRFTVAATVCTVDDSKDGYGATHDSSVTWCNANTGGTPVDAAPADYKRFTVTVTPPAGSTDKATTMSEIVGVSSLDGSAGVGLGSGRAILQSPLCSNCSKAAWDNYGQVAPCKTFTSTVGTDMCNPTYNTTSITAIPVKTIWPVAPASVSFYLGSYPASYSLDPPSAIAVETSLGAGTVDPSTGRIFNFSWALANTYPNQTPDGLYYIKAVAYNGSGQQLGDPQVLSFWLNRFIPDMGYWDTLLAGKNTQSWGASKPEIEWYHRGTGGRRDFDIKEFKVYRSGTSTLACMVYSWDYYNTRVFPSPYTYGFGMETDLSDTSVPHACRDATAPASGTLTYTVKASNFSPDGLAQTEGANFQTSPNVNAAPANTMPVAPSGLTASWIGTGLSAKVKLTWSLPAGRGAGGADAAPDCVISFRIYHGLSTDPPATVTLAQRYSRTSYGVNSPAPCTTSTSTTWTDNWYSYGGTSQRYWVTSIDSRLGESTPATVTVAAPP